ncbi:MAG: peptidase S51 dipeptidase E [Candidatus Peregrinibacteria bacterium Greene0416_62]|nr:MAG: peptidase S51 dipeptidase E [Candidatus Peregrinibacteria bacterium Greene0416_62]TSC98738.1 MAG: peptidase S51 dipeptidase E [Candidatus Peregrinibacteria bacterium Greene1014_49]
MTKRRAIIAIGGGHLRKASTLPIDREIVRLSGKKHPKLLFIPTASLDSIRYQNFAHRYFGKRLGCKVDVLLLLKNPPTPTEIKRKVLGADIIYVGGGNTLMMMKLWRRLGVDRLLKQAWSRGTVLCGISAGSICWFASGHSDSLSFYNPKRWKYINVRGLGFLKGIHCPHFDSHTLGVPRKKHFERMIGKIGGMGIAIENYCAIAFIGGHYRVIPAKKNAGVYRVFKRRGKVVTERIPKEGSLKPIATLFIK